MTECQSFGALPQAGSLLRLKHIEKRKLEDVDVLLHGAPQNPFLWPDLTESVRPGGKHVPVVVQPVVLRACRPGGGVIWPVVLFISLSSLLALAIVGLPGAEWCAYAARAWAIDCCSCRQAARSRRPLRRWASADLGCQLGISQQK